VSDYFVRSSAPRHACTASADWILLDAHFGRLVLNVSYSFTDEQRDLALIAFWAYCKNSKIMQNILITVACRSRRKKLALAPVKGDRKMSSRCNDITRLQDLMDITTLKTRYTRYLDSKRWEDWGGLMAEDIVMDLGEGQDPVVGRDVVVNFLRENVGDAVTVHQVHAGEITFTGEDTADAIWPMFDEVEDHRFHLRGFGFYDESYRRIDGEWRITRWRLLRTRQDWHAKSLPVKLVKFAFDIGLLRLVAPKIAKQFHENVYARMSPGDLK
jgi:hypothetical protein